MYCPKCRAEFREGILECSDCGVPLVKSIPPEKPEPVPEYVDFEEIATSYDPGEIEMMKSILNDNKIYYFIQDENFGSVIGGSLPARILVKKENAREAKELLEDFI